MRRVREPAPESAEAGMAEIEDILDFWFSDDSRQRWFQPTPEFDRAVRRRFARPLARAVTGELDGWRESAEGCLGLCILLDQVPRHIFRGDAEAFAADDKALAVAEHALAKRFDRGLAPEQKQFLYMPFMHSERLSNQLRALALCEANGLHEAGRHAAEHLAIVRRFGRFPHRNDALGRPSTEAEAAYLRESGNHFGQRLEQPVATVPLGAAVKIEDAAPDRTAAPTADQAPERGKAGNPPGEHENERKLRGEQPAERSTAPSEA